MSAREHMERILKELSEALAHYKRFVELAPSHRAARLAREQIADLERGGTKPAAIDDDAR